MADSSLTQRLARAARRSRQRLQQDPAASSRAVQHQPLHRLALHERLGVGQERHQLLQPLGAAELAQQEGRGAAHLPVRRVHQLLHDSRPRGAEADQDVAQPAARARVLFGRQHLGERRDDRRADGVAEPLEPLVAVVVGAAQVRRRRASSSSRGRSARARRARAACAPDRAAPCVDDGFGELPGLVEVADAHEIVGVRRRRSRATSRQRSGSASIASRSSSS